MSITTLLTAAGVIKNETTNRANTATRIGKMFEDIITYFNKSYLNIYDYVSNSVTAVLLDDWKKLEMVPTVGFDNNGLELNGSNQIVNNSTTKVFKITGIASITSGNNNEIHFSVYKNGSIIPCSEQSVVTSSAGKANAIPFQCLVELEQTQYIEIFVKNATSNTSITLKNINVIIDSK